MNRISILVCLMTLLLVGCGRSVSYERVEHKRLGVSLELPRSWTIHTDHDRRGQRLALFAGSREQIQFRLLQRRGHPELLLAAEHPWHKNGTLTVDSYHMRWASSDDRLLPHRRNLHYTVSDGKRTFVLAFSAGRSRFDEFRPIFAHIAGSLRFKR